MSIFSQLWLPWEQVGQPQDGKSLLPVSTGASARTGVPAQERGDPGYEQKLGGWGRGAVRAALPTRITKKQRGVKPHS